MESGDLGTHRYDAQEAAHDIAGFCHTARHESNRFPRAVDFAEITNYILS